LLRLISEQGSRLTALKDVELEDTENEEQEKKEGLILLRDLRGAS
jgi:hypothetical protein